MGMYSLHPIDCTSDTASRGSAGLRGWGHPLTTCAPRLWRAAALRLGGVEPHRRCENWFSAVKSEASKLAGNGVPENPLASRGPFPLPFSCPPLVALSKHLLTHIFVSTIAFLTVNFCISSQDKGICEQTEIFIVVFCLAECSPSNICLCDTLGLPRAVGCSSAAHPRLGYAHQKDLLSRHSATDPQVAPFWGALASPHAWL